MTTTQLSWRVVIAEPLSLAMAQPHQALISCASVALMAQFASSSKIIDPIVGYALAIGVEWAYLRGLVADSKTTTAWGARLNWSAFAIVVLWGCLWCLKQFGIITETPTDALAFGLALAHVVPIAWLSLCSAMSHRAMVQAEAAHVQVQQQRFDDEARRLREAQNALQLEEAKERTRLALWKDAQTFKAQLGNQTNNQKQRVVQPFVPGQMGCKYCGQSVGFSTPSEKGVLVRLGCVDCRANRKANKGE